MLEGLYRMATADLTSDSSDFAFELMTRGGHRSWIEMLSANATMTIEHWYGTNTGTANDKHSWSHPWSASPARIIPQWLLGVRPLERAWRRIAVHPQPGSTLARAQMTVPTIRGDVAFAFSRELFPGGSFALNVTIPGNTNAEVCLPLALLPKSRVVTVGGKPVPVLVPAERPGQVCLASDLEGGDYAIKVHQR